MTAPAAVPVQVRPAQAPDLAAWAAMRHALWPDADVRALADEARAMLGLKGGDKVAAIGLGALVLGGAAAVATKKGLWGIIGGFLAATWKFLIAGAVALFAGAGKLFGRKKKKKKKTG